MSPFKGNEKFRYGLNVLEQCDRNTHRISDLSSLWVRVLNGFDHWGKKNAINKVASISPILLTLPSVTTNSLGSIHSEVISGL